jgi:hypothetical protein
MWKLYELRLIIHTVLHLPVDDLDSEWPCVGSDEVKDRRKDAFNLAVMLAPLCL